jgi:hypothetical protein
MEVIINRFDQNETHKNIGFTVKSGESILGINKEIELSESKTNDEYISEAYTLCQPEINEWLNSVSVIGKKFNPATNSFE